MSAEPSRWRPGGGTPRQPAHGHHGVAVRPRKALGQHFLVDPIALERIAMAAEVGPGETVLEIGAGTGELTQALLAAGASVVAVELDEQLCAQLRRRFVQEPRLHIICANILDHAPEELLREAGRRPPYKVAANIPYYITAPIVRGLLEAEMPPRRAVLTVQREVAESIAAKPGSLSLLAVSVQAYATARIALTLPPAAFRPIPKVASAVVVIDLAPQPLVDKADRETFFEVVRAGFRSPRKQLHNALGRALWIPAGEVTPLLQAAEIDPMRRAQTLSIEEWYRLSRLYGAARERWRDTARTIAAGGQAETR